MFISGPECGLIVFFDHQFWILCLVFLILYALLLLICCIHIFERYLDGLLIEQLLISLHVLNHCVNICHLCLSVFLIFNANKEQIKLTSYSKNIFQKMFDQHSDHKCVSFAYKIVLSVGGLASHTETFAHNALIACVHSFWGLSKTLLNTRGVISLIFSPVRSL